MEHAPFELSPQIKTTGIRNAVNSCYMNCIIQCLSHTVELSTIALFNEAHLCEAPRPELCDVCYFKSLMKIPFGSKVNPAGLLKKILLPELFEDFHLQLNRTFFKDFIPERQEDAHEFFEAFLKFAASLGYDVDSVFQGFLVSIIPCPDCLLRDEEDQLFRDIRLNIGAAGRLEELLVNFFGNQEINAKCQRHKNVKIEKISKIRMLPLVMVFHLNWFFEVDGEFQKKQNHLFEFPLELDFRPFLGEEKSKNSKYKLYAIVEHFGEKMNSGHYFCYVRFEENVWYKFDDLKVTRAEEGVILASKPYLLFYNSKDVPWFSNYYRAQFDQIKTGVESGLDLGCLNHSNSSSESGSSCSNMDVEENAGIEDSRYLSLLCANEKLHSCFAERLKFVSNLAGNHEWLKRADRHAPACAAVDKSNLVKILFLQNTQPLFDESMKSEGKKKEPDLNKRFSTSETKVLLEAVKVHGKLFSKIRNSCFVLSSRSNKSLGKKWHSLLSLANQLALPAENPKHVSISDGMALAVLKVELRHCALSDKGAILERIDQLQQRIKNSRKRQQGKSKRVGSE